MKVYDPLKSAGRTPKGSLYLYTRPSRVLTDRDFAIASMKAKGYYYSKELPERVMTILSEEYDFVFKVL